MAPQAHTPGPWRVHQMNHADGALWLTIGFKDYEGTSDPDGRWIGPVADLRFLNAREEEQWANARLIAAAPDLLAACEAMSAHLRNGWPQGVAFETIVDAMRAAIAKARPL